MDNKRKNEDESEKINEVGKQLLQLQAFCDAALAAIADDKDGPMATALCSFMSEQVTRIYGIMPDDMKKRHGPPPIWSPHTNFEIN